MRPVPRMTSRVVAIGVAALVAADVALVALALAHTSPAPANGSRVGALPVATATRAPRTPPPTGASRTPPSPTATSSGTPTTTGPPTVSVEPVPLRSTLVALGELAAWRSAAGSCGAGGGAVSVTSDGGKTWSAGAVPAQAVMRVRPSSATRAFVISAGADCAPGVRTTTNGGATWGQAGAVGSTWFRDPADPQLVHSPGPREGRPCGATPVLDLAPVTASGAQVLCGDGTVRATGDSGASWSPVGAVPGALALDARVEQGGSTAYVLLRPGDACRGLQVVRVAQTPTASEVLGCVDVAGGPVEAGTMSLSINGANGWVMVGDRVWRSQDGLRSWAPG